MNPRAAHRRYPRRLFERSTQASRRGRHCLDCRRLALERLEDRLVLSSMFWEGSAQVAGDSFQEVLIAEHDDESAAEQITGDAKAEFVTMPYLQNMTPESMVIMWEMDAAESVTVEYGLTTDYGSSTPATSEDSGFGTYIFKAELAGLLPATEYHYRLADDGSSPMTGDRLFTTGTDEKIDFSFGAWADSQDSNGGVWSADPLQPTTSMMAHMAQSDVDFAFSIGDMATNGASYSDTRNYYLDRAAKYLGQTVPWFNAWGNHDTGSSSAIVRRFADMPSKERPGYTPGFGSFYFTYSDVLFIAIDYYDDGVITSGWLESLLQSDLNQNARFTILGIHVPPYCEMSLDGNASYRANLVPLMEQYGVDVCISGHRHEYERGFLNGVYYVITGGGSWLAFGSSYVRDWPHMTVGGYHDLAGSWAMQLPGSPGVLGPPEPIKAGTVNEYVRVEIIGDHLELDMHAFNADGSYIGVLDSFAFGDTSGVNDPPSFDGAVLVKSSAWSGIDYSDSLSGDATDPDSGDALTFSKIAGPAWLNVAPDGTLSGKPRMGDVGQNTFTVWVTDPGDLSDEATLRITAERSASSVAGRYVFYNNSAFDGGDPGADDNDDNAIAPDKTALLPGQRPTFENYTSYRRGINGIMVDLFAAPGPITAADFEFRVGNDDNPDVWAPLSVVPAVDVRLGDGVDDSDRVTIIFPDNEIEKQWLQVTVLASDQTGLTEPDVFYFGNAIGETGNSAGDAIVNVQDVLATHDNPHPFWDPAGIENRYDFNRDQRVDMSDVLIAWANQTWSITALKLWRQPTLVLITEAATGNPDYVEIQNVFTHEVDTSGWMVAVNDAHDVNSVHTTLWHLPDSMLRDEARYRSDDSTDEDNYWGGGIYWTTSGSGWVMIVDDRGKVADFVAWGYDAAEIATIEIDVGGFEGITVGDAWSGAGVVAGGEPNNSLQRTGNADHNDASDWAFTELQSPGEPNEGLSVPFTGGAPGKSLPARLDTKESATSIQTMSAHDAVLKQAGDLESESRETPISKVAWLHEFEQVIARSGSIEGDRPARGPASCRGEKSSQEILRLWQVLS